MITPANAVVAIHIVVDNEGRYYYILSIPPQTFEGPEGGCDNAYEAMCQANILYLRYDLEETARRHEMK